MKTKTLLAVLFVAALGFQACSEEEIASSGLMADAKSAIIDGKAICTDSIFTTTIDDLTEADIAGLSLMREEEKLAREVYTLFYSKYEVLTFSRIAESESKHMDAVKRLLDHFGLEDPASDALAEFNNADLQKLYDELTEAGDKSLVEALLVAALIEETDILDLQELIAATKNADLVTVYSNLLRGSYNHLKAFTRQLSLNEVEYAPVLLSAEVYQEILANSNGKGRGQNGVCDGSGEAQGKRGFKGRGFQTGNGAMVCDSTGVGAGTPIQDGSGNLTRGNSNKGKGKRGGNN